MIHDIATDVGGKGADGVQRIDSIRLSICISTYMRGNLISETLGSIIKQIEPGVEIVVVDGASPDNTHEIMAGFVREFPCIRYFREPVNSGVDRDFDKALAYAIGDFCWLMGDDDLLKPGALGRVLEALSSDKDLIIVNSEVRNLDMSRVLESRRLDFNRDRIYNQSDRDTFFVDTANYLTYIGCVVIRRELWLARVRDKYIGSLFIHVGVIFQTPSVANAYVIAEPLISIRYGNGMWTQRRFEIWMFLWPELIWSFSDFSSSIKSKICRREPRRNLRFLLYYRALGAFSLTDYQKYFANDEMFSRFFPLVVSISPASILNTLFVLYFSHWSRKKDLLRVSDLLSSRYVNPVSKFLGRQMGLGN